MANQIMSDVSNIRIPRPAKYNFLPKINPESREVEYEINADWILMGLRFRANIIYNLKTDVLTSSPQLLKISIEKAYKDKSKDLIFYSDCTYNDRTSILEVKGSAVYLENSIGSNWINVKSVKTLWSCKKISDRFIWHDLDRKECLIGLCIYYQIPEYQNDSNTSETVITSAIKDVLIDEFKQGNFNHTYDEIKRIYYQSPDQDRIYVFKPRKIDNLSILAVDYTVECFNTEQSIFINSKHDLSLEAHRGLYFDAIELVRSFIRSIQNRICQFSSSLINIVKSFN